MEPALNGLLVEAAGARVIRAGVSAAEPLKAAASLCHRTQGEEPRYACSFRVSLGGWSGAGCLPVALFTWDKHQIDNEQERNHFMVSSAGYHATPPD
jgi:hypothetical protein